MILPGGLVHLYGFVVGLGILVGFCVAVQMARHFSLYPKPYTLNPNDVWDALWWAVIPGIVGARIYHVLDFWEYYREHLVQIPMIWKGGLGIFGAIIGGLFGLWLYSLWICRRELRSLNKDLLGHKRFGLKSIFTIVKYARLIAWPSDRRKFVELSALQENRLFSCCLWQRFLRLLDLAAFGLPIGQAIGRWANYFNQELYGKPTDLPWGIFISLEKRAQGFEDYTHFHPLFLYESVYTLLIFLCLLFLKRQIKKRLHAGSYFFVYLILYGSGRFGLEQLRTVSWTIFGINVTQGISFLSLLTGVVLLYSFNRN